MHWHRHSPLVVCRQWRTRRSMWTKRPCSTRSFQTARIACNCWLRHVWSWTRCTDWWVSACWFMRSRQRTNSESSACVKRSWETSQGKGSKSTWSWHSSGIKLPKLLAEPSWVAVSSTDSFVVEHQGHGYSSRLTLSPRRACFARVGFSCQFIASAAVPWLLGSCKPKTSQRWWREMVSRRTIVLGPLFEYRVYLSFCVVV